MMQFSLTRFLRALCYAYLAFSVVPAHGQAKAATPSITVYQTPT